MKRAHKVRRTILVIVALISFAMTLLVNPDLYQSYVAQQPIQTTENQSATGDAARVLAKLDVKGRAPRTDYSRSQFGNGWAIQQGCDMRNIILHRDLTDTRIDDSCRVQSGMLVDPYTSKTISFTRGSTSSQDVQIDHVVALSNAWQTGAQALSTEKREQFANDPLELLAVDGPANQQKSDGDAATWLPANKAFRCQYVARQIAVKAKYDLWVTLAEKQAMTRVLTKCPGQPLPSS
ncbi:MAG TPA: HNH endonuclease family protein [Candidatus Saccharimonadales bacterium]|nr:HNH endonuclease family protein [Candidatus Saccharimonadales bacterium]